MLNFRENFFFVKFSVLLFFVVIFGYWGVDLNSEEVYIAFSFLFLTILAFVASRQTLLLIFVRSVNTKFARLVSDLFGVASSLMLQKNWLLTLRGYFQSLSKGVFYFCVLTVELLGTDGASFAAMLSSRVDSILLYNVLGVTAFSKLLVRGRGASAVYSSFSRFFIIAL